MSFSSDLKGILGAVAPALATAVGGPLAGVATRVIAGQLLGNEDAELAEIETALLHASPADLAKLREIDAQFKRDMKAAQVDLEEVAAGDRASARDRQVQLKDWTPTLLGLVIIVGFFGTLSYIFLEGLPESGTEVLLIMLGALGTMTTQVCNFFFGSSVGSKTKDLTIAKLKGQDA